MTSASESAYRRHEALVLTRSELHHSSHLRAKIRQEGMHASLLADARGRDDLYFGFASQMQATHELHPGSVASKPLLYSRDSGFVSTLTSISLGGSASEAWQGSWTVSY